MGRRTTVAVVLSAVLIAVLAALLWLRRDRTAADTGPQAGRVPSQEPAAEQLAGTNGLIPPLNLSTVSDSLRGVLGYGEKKNYITRVRAVQELGRNLPLADVQALYAFLNKRASQDNLPPAELNTVKNNILNVLGRQTKPPTNFGRVLIAMSRDKEHDVLWRDYCLQHLGGWYRKAASDDEKEDIASALWDATGEKKGSISGTALLSLSFNVGGPGIAEKAVSGKALQACQDKEYSEMAKITALQVCATLGETQALPVARDLATGSGNALLRMSALAAIGALGDARDRPLLEKYAASSDVRLRKAARAALDKLNARFP